MKYSGKRIKVKIKESIMKEHEFEPYPEDILDFTRYKFEKWMRRTAPVFAAWEITNACNLRCKYCGLDSGEPLEDELNTEEALDIIDDISSAGTRSLMLIGGEPTVRSDIFKIIEYASMFMSVAMNTNGVMVDDDYAKKLKEAGISQVKVSLDGRRSHDMMRGKSYEKAVSAIKSCKKAGIQSVVIEMTVSKLNYDEVPEMVDFAMDSGLSIVINEFVPIGRGRERKDLLISRKEREKMHKFLLDKRRIFGEHRIGFEDRYIITDDDVGIRRFADPFCNAVNVGCTAGIFCYGIKPNGKVIPCPIFRMEVGDLREKSLREIWRDSEELKKLRDRNNLKGKCGTCEYRFVCGGCRGRTYAITGDFLEEDPLCWYSASAHHP